MAAAWAMCAEGVEEAVLVEAPVVPEGWERPPWVRLRALTEAEALERESLGLCEEYELVSGGLAEPQIHVRRTYDLRAMAEYDYSRCVVDFWLPELRESGVVVGRRLDPGAPAENVAFLGRMQPELSAWVWGAIEAVNHRQAHQRAEIELAKKS